jgi:hypothetical protein
MNGNNPYKSSLTWLIVCSFRWEHAVGLPAGLAANVSRETAKALLPGHPGRVKF